MERKAFLITALAAVLGAVAAAVLASGRASVLVFVGTASLWVFALLPAAAALVAILVVRHRSERRRPALERLAGIDAGFLLFLLLLVPANYAGGRLGEWRIARAKEESRASVMVLEEYRERFGRYPEDLAEAAAAGVAVPVPGLADPDDYYHSWSDGSFTLYLPDRTAFLFGGWIYFSDRGEWSYDD